MQIREIMNVCNYAHIINQVIEGIVSYLQIRDLFIIRWIHRCQISDTSMRVAYYYAIEVKKHVYSRIYIEPSRFLKSVKISKSIERNDSMQ